MRLFSSALFGAGLVGGVFVLYTTAFGASYSLCSAFCDQKHDQAVQDCWDQNPLPYLLGPSSLVQRCISNLGFTEFLRNCINQCLTQFPSRPEKPRPAPRPAVGPFRSIVPPPRPSESPPTKPPKRIPPEEFERWCRANDSDFGEQMSKCDIFKRRTLEPREAFCASLAIIKPEQDPDIVKKQQHCQDVLNSHIATYNKCLQDADKYLRACMERLAEPGLPLEESRPPVNGRPAEAVSGGFIGRLFEREKPC